MCPESTQKSDLTVNVCSVSASMTKWDMEQNNQSMGGHRPLVLCREWWPTDELMSQTDTRDCPVTPTQELWHLLYSHMNSLTKYIHTIYTHKRMGEISGIILPCLKPSKTRGKWSQVLVTQEYSYSISICRKHFLKVFCISKGIWDFQGDFLSNCWHRSFALLLWT